MIVSHQRPHRGSSFPRVCLNDSLSSAIQRFPQGWVSDSSASPSQKPNDSEVLSMAGLSDARASISAGGAAWTTGTGTPLRPSHQTDSFFPAFNFGTCENSGKISDARMCRFDLNVGRKVNCSLSFSPHAIECFELPSSEGSFPYRSVRNISVPSIGQGCSGQNQYCTAAPRLRSPAHTIYCTAVDTNIGCSYLFFFSSKLIISICDTWRATLAP